MLSFGIFKKGLMLIFAAIVAIFVSGMLAALLGTILPDLSDRFRFTPTQNGTMALAQALGLVIASVSVGWLLDSEGEKLGLLLGFTLISIVLYALPRSPGFRSIVFLLFLLGVGGGAVLTGANTLVSHISDAHRATTLNLVNLFFGLGGLATPFISANLLKGNWVRLCYSIATLTVASLIVEAITRMPSATPGAAGHGIADFGSASGRPLLFLLGLFLFLYMSCEAGVWNWLPRHLIAQGVPESRALNILSLGFALGLLIGRIGISPILIRVPAVTVALVASIAMALTTFLMLHTNRPNLASSLVFVAGLSMAPVFPTTVAIVGGAFPRMAGTAIGFVMTCGYAGLAVSSRLIGAIAGSDPLRLKRALLLIPGAALLMIGVNLAISSALR